MDKRTSQQIKSLLNDPKFDSIDTAKEEYLKKIKDENVIGNNEFEVLRNTFTKEGKIQSIVDFFNQLEQC